MKKRYLIIISFLILGSFCWLNFKIDNSTKGIIGVYIEGEYSSNVPLKNSGYYVDKIECDNGSSGEWDYVNWGLLTTNMSKKSKCNVYFRKDTIVEAIKNELDTTGKCPTVNDDNNINVVDAYESDNMLCSAPDNYGTSYYYRGNVKNNYVKFAGFYWRIVRINGDGSIRLAYDGTMAHENNESNADKVIGNSAFNEESEDNAYVGYMYGTPNSSTYEETHANINDSAIKKYVDNWYESNLKGTSYEQFLTDNIFCNDRSVMRYSDKSDYSNLGYGIEKTTYTHHGGGQNKLTCSSKNDSFNASGTNNGNGKLLYKIGLLTVDEVNLAGGLHDNINYYLYTGTRYFTMTPCDNVGAATFIRFVTETGKAYASSLTTNKYGVKPVINLKPNSLISGDGTINNPYIVE